MKRLAAVAVYAIALLVTGCGSSGSGQLSDAAFTSKANAICTAANSTNSTITSTKKGLPALTAEESNIATTIKKLKALDAPSNRAKSFHSYISDVEQLDGVLFQLASAASAHDATKIASIESGVPGLETAGKTDARAAGIDSCD